MKKQNLGFEIYNLKIESVHGTVAYYQYRANRRLTKLLLLAIPLVFFINYQVSAFAGF